MTGPRVYLDYNATAPLRPVAREAMLAALGALGNPSSIHAEGRA
ncbi:MAG: cysteine desulfurase, partial [Methylocystis sp.]